MMASPENEAAVAAAVAQAMADAQHRQNYYRTHAGVPAGTSGPEGNAPLTLPEDRAVTGTHHAGGA